MVLVILMITLVETSLVHASLLHGFGRSMGHRHRSHQVCRPVERIVYVLKRVAGHDPVQGRSVQHVVSAIGLIKLRRR